MGYNDSRILKPSAAKNQKKVFTSFDALLAEVQNETRRHEFRVSEKVNRARFLLAERAKFQRRIDMINQELGSMKGECDI